MSFFFCVGKQTRTYACDTCKQFALITDQSSIKMPAIIQGCRLPLAHSPMRPNLVCGQPEIKNRSPTWRLESRSTSLKVLVHFHKRFLLFTYRHYTKVQKGSESIFYLQKSVLVTNLLVFNASDHD